MNPVGIYEKAFPDELTWNERLDQAARCGYDFMEMSIDESEQRLSRLEWSTSNRLELRRMVENSGVPILTMGLSCHRKYALGSKTPENRQKGLEIFRNAIDLAYDLDVRIIQLMGYDVYYEQSDTETQERFLEGLSQGARWASAAGVMLALENVDVDTVNSVEKAIRFVREVNSPWLGLYPDIGNLVAAGYDPVKQLAYAQGHLVGIHVKDALPGEVRGVTLGKGHVPFDDVFKYLGGLDYSGPFAVEMWAHLDATGDPVTSAIEARRWVGCLISDYIIQTNRRMKD